jgi:hypothetical protein
MILLYQVMSKLKHWWTFKICLFVSIFYYIPIISICNLYKNNLSVYMKYCFITGLTITWIYGFLIYIQFNFNKTHE